MDIISVFYTVPLFSNIRLCPGNFAKSVWRRYGFAKRYSFLFYMFSWPTSKKKTRFLLKVNGLNSEKHKH